MKIIFGLGNPGKKYDQTRHNVGFLAIDFLREQMNSPDWKEGKFQSLMTQGEGVTFVKPLTFMNLSGTTVAGYVHFYKLDPKNDILIISDDLDMEFGKVRYRAKGSHGGQNGLRDIIEKLGTDEFSRIKIGIGRNDQYEVVDWVLSKFQKHELESLDTESFPKIETLINDWLGGSIK